MSYINIISNTDFAPSTQTEERISSGTENYLIENNNNNNNNNNENVEDVQEPNSNQYNSLLNVVNDNDDCLRRTMTASQARLFFRGITVTGESDEDDAETNSIDQSNEDIMTRNSFFVCDFDRDSNRFTDSSLIDSDSDNDNVSFRFSSENENSRNFRFSSENENSRNFRFSSENENSRNSGNDEDINANSRSYLRRTQIFG